MMNAKLNAISNEAASNLQALVRENEAKLLEAWNSCEEEAQANETAPKFKLALSITLDLDGDKMTTDLSWGVRYKDTAECTIPNPDQGKLALDKGETITLETEGRKPVTVTTKKFNDFLQGKIKAANPDTKGGAA